jgi:hypothetical protein
MGDCQRIATPRLTSFLELLLEEEAPSEDNESEKITRCFGDMQPLYLRLYPPGSVIHPKEHISLGGVDGGVHP